MRRLAGMAVLFAGLFVLLETNDESLPWLLFGGLVCGICIAVRDEIVFGKERR